MPPLVPASTYLIPRPRSVSARRTSSVHFVLPPSMMMSPGDRSVASVAMVDSVGAPAGTMTQTGRGGVSAFTSPSSELTPCAPPCSTAARAASAGSYATIWWRARSSRVTMLPPIRPRPTNPICISATYPCSPVAVSTALSID
jgi:hypothetical protein